MVQPDIFNTLTCDSLLMRDALVGIGPKVEEGQVLELPLNRAMPGAKSAKGARYSWSREF